MTSKDILVDFGSGKGRFIYLATSYPLKKIIGIEICPHLHRIALRNMELQRKWSKCRNISLINADAAGYTLEDRFTIAYFYNPFVDDLFITVIERIRHSLKKDPRPLWIIYKNPVMKPFLDTCDWLYFEHMSHNIAYYRARLSAFN